VALKRRQQAGQRAEAQRQRRRQRRLWFGTGFFVLLPLIFAGFMAYATWKANRALRDANAMRLAAEGGAMTSPYCDSPLSASGRRYRCQRSKTVSQGIDRVNSRDPRGTEDRQPGLHLLAPTAPALGRCCRIGGASSCNGRR
jgi:hypothetical protein